MTRSYVLCAVIAAMLTVGCSKPGVDGLRESFATQLASNRYIQNFQRAGGDLIFSGPTVDGEVARWRVHVDSAAIEDNNDQGKPYKGVIKASWYVNEQLVTPMGRDSNLPLQLTANGLAQECWALWNSTSKTWEWE